VFPCSLRADRRHVGVLLFLAFGMIPLAGCGKARKPVIVAGKVSYKGQPVGGGTIALHPVTEGAPIPGGIRPDGTFSFGDVPPGEYQVAIETESIRQFAKKGGNYMKMSGAKVPEGMKVSDAPDSSYVAIPKKFADPKTSGLTWKVEGMSPTKDFDLTN
jgi:hypothetical protein